MRTRMAASRECASGASPRTRRGSSGGGIVATTRSGSRARRVASSSACAGCLGSRLQLLAYFVSERVTKPVDASAEASMSKSKDRSLRPILRGLCEAECPGRRAYRRACLGNAAAASSDTLANWVVVRFGFASALGGMSRIDPRSSEMLGTADAPSDVVDGRGG